MRITDLILAAALLVMAPAGASAQTPATEVILVRHAEKADEPGGDPSLSVAGEARARALADALRDEKVAAVLVTPYKRTSATAAPLATARGLVPITVAVNGGLSAYAKSVTEIVRSQYAGRTVLVVGHSNTIPAVIAALGGPKVNELCESEYSMMYVLTLDGSAAPKLVASHYGAPDSAGATSCRMMMAPGVGTP